MRKNNFYFIGIPLPAALQAYYASWQAELKKVLPYTQWTNPLDFHLTLKFLGPVDLHHIYLLDNQLRDISKTHPFTLRLDSLGIFGEKSTPRVLWVGLDYERALADLYEKVEKIAFEIGFPKEKRAYHPHITLAKKWADFSQIFSYEILEGKYQEKQKEFLVHEIVMYQINPKQSPKYKRVQTYSLRGE